MSEILTGWKEIAVFLKVSDKTAQRYRKEKGLPVRINKAGHPIITKEKVERWLLQ